MNIRINTKYLVISILVILFLLLTFLNKHADNEQPERTEKIILKNLNDSDKNNTEKNTEAPVVSKLLGKKDQCTDMAEVIDKARQTWRVHNFPIGDKLLDMGYSVDEVTLAKEHFINKNGAMRWRTNHFKSESVAGKKDKRITDYFVSIVNSLGGTGFRAHYKYPQPEIENYHEMSKDQQKQILTKFVPVVDDIAAFIRLKSDDVRKPTEHELLNLLRHVEYPEQIVSDRTGPLLTLLDYSVVNSYWNMFDYLIKHNVPLTQDWYLRTTLDRALSRLSYLLKNENENKTDISNTVKMISILMEEGGEAHIDRSEPERITNNAKTPFPVFNFNQQQIQNLLENYQLDLTELKKMPIPDMSLIGDAIIGRFEKERNDFIQQAIRSQNYGLTRKDCKDFIKADYFNKVVPGLF